MIIKAIKKENGTWIMADENGNLVQEGHEHKTRKSVYNDCNAMYPFDSVWKGKKVRSGFYIDAE